MRIEHRGFLLFMTREEYLKSRTKPTPEKYCEYCGKKLERKRFGKKGKIESITQFLNRKYCDFDCMRKGFVIKDGTHQSNGPAHASARKIVNLIENREKVCELCGSTKNVDIHHKDHNFNNNSSENLMLVCRSCHMKLHRPANNICKICGKECKKTTHGMCDKHYLRWKKYGDPLHEPWSQYKEKASKGPIYRYTLDGIKIGEYESLREASRISGFARSSIAAACNGNRKTLNNNIWSYEEL